MFEDELSCGSVGDSPQIPSGYHDVVELMVAQSATERLNILGPRVLPPVWTSICSSGGFSMRGLPTISGRLQSVYKGEHGERGVRVGGRSARTHFRSGLEFSIPSPIGQMVKPF
jgi:hypothetical protein